MSWSSRILPEAKRDIEKLDRPIQRRIFERLWWLINSFDQITPLSLTADFRGFLKLRVGDWRVVYEVKMDEQEIVIHAVDHRDKIYKR